MCWSLWMRPASTCGVELTGTMSSVWSRSVSDKTLALAVSV